MLPIGSAALLGVGAFAAALHGRVGPDGVLACCAVIVGLTAATSTLTAAVEVAVVGWLTAVGFARAPYADLEAHDRPITAAAIVLLSVTIAGIGLRATLRGAQITLDDMSTRAQHSARRPLIDFVAAVDGRRRRWGIGLATLLLTALTFALTAIRSELSLADDLLIYLLAVIAVAVVGGFGPAVLAAAAASFCLNWFFTPPLHTLTIEEPTNLLALLLFILVALSVSSVVHVAAGRATLAAERANEARSLLLLARTILGVDDSPGAVLAYVRDELGVEAELQERVAGRWVRVAGSGLPDPDRSHVFTVRDDLRFVADSDHGTSAALMEAAARLAAAALDRERLRTQASQAEALEAGNRMRTALLAAVSHDLRTPLASIKASVSSLRQPDVAYSPEDERELLATVEESSDRLDGLIANLLDMSRLQTGALNPIVGPVAVEEVAALALHGLPGAAAVRLDVPEDLPLLRTDAGLLERALANLLSNALRYSPASNPPLLRARRDRDELVISVIDHGPGVVATARQSMFEPFQRLGDTNTATGVGLGLAVARGFIEAMAGSVTAGETPGGGLTMTVRLPSATQPARSAPRTAS